MEAKDTYLSKKLAPLSKLKNMGDLNEDVMALLDKQAEISFKIGKTAGVAESLIPAVKAIEESRKAGRKEVVDWIEERCLDEYIAKHYCDIGGEDIGPRLVGKMTAPPYTAWKKQLKEWGL